MPEVKNCLTCKWEPEWKEEERPNYDDNGYQYGAFISHFARDCQNVRAYSRALDILPPHYFLESYGLEKREDQIFVDGLPDKKIMACPAHQPKE